jgi:hypothetical protein
MKVSVLESFVRHGVRLVVLFVFASGMACVCMAQAAGAAAQPAPKVAVPAAKPAMTTLAAQAELPAAPGERQPRGAHEGITVHGHWTIEVRNPDGKLVSHTEFENALAPNGAALLAGLLTGTATPGSWWVYLASDSSGDGAIVFAEPNSTAASQCQATVQHPYPYQICFDTLSVTGSQLGSGGLSGNTVTLTGSASLSSSAPAETIAWVETESFGCSPSISPSACFDAASSGESSQPLTARNLGDGVGSDPPSVQVSPGQAISVSVVISFGSGS